METSAAQSSREEDEIDLLELLGVIWEGRWLLLLIVAIAGMMGGGYALWVEPVYEAKVRLSPSDDSGVMELWQLDWLVAQDGENLKSQRFSSDKVYDHVIAELGSVQVKSSYWSDRRDVGGRANGNVTQNLNSASLVITVPKKRQATRVATLVVRSGSADTAAVVANDYARYVLEKARQDFAHILNNEIDSRQQLLDKAIGERIASYRDSLDQELIKLNEALEIAKSLGIENPLRTVAYVGSTGLIIDEIRKLYQQGVRSLAAEIKALSHRRENVTKDLVPGLLELQQEKALLASMQIDPAKIVPARVVQSAEVPVAPIKPKKSLIITLSLILGLMLGVVVLLGRSAYLKYKAGVSPTP